jgi:hypothetical protein
MPIGRPTVTLRTRHVITPVNSTTPIIA